MRVFFVAENPDRRPSPEGTGDPGLELEPITGRLELADALLAVERRLASAQDGAVVLGDASDLSLAAALVAAKSEMPLAATGAALDPPGRNGRLIAQIAAAALGDDPSEIAAWVRSADGPSPLG
jgi:hypothetical protein